MMVNMKILDFRIPYQTTIWCPLGPRYGRCMVYGNISTEAPHTGVPEKESDQIVFLMIDTGGRTLMA
jgi:hypothetical protein